MNGLKHLVKVLILAGLLISVFPMTSVAASYDPNTDSEFVPKGKDLPNTNAPLVQYDKYPLSHYNIDIYKPIDEEDKNVFEKMWDKINVFSIPSDAMKYVKGVEFEMVNNLWAIYTLASSAAMYLVEEAFTFDLVGKMMGFVSDLISTIGGDSGVGQFMSFMMILVCGWLIWVFAKREFRKVFAGLLVSAVLAGFYTLYIYNSDQLMDFVNSNTNKISNVILNSSTYNLDETGIDNQKGILTNNEAERQVAAEKQKMADGETKYYGISRIRNIMHDLLIVKPWLMMEYGTTNLAIIGGADSKKEYDQAHIAKGKEQVKALLSAKPGSDERLKAIEKQHKRSYMTPGYTNQRIVISVLIWFPALVILPILAGLAVFVQMYGIILLILAVTGVFVMMLAIFPVWRPFLRQWVGKILSAAAYKIGIAFMLVLMFSFTNMAYKLSEGGLWSYGKTVMLIIIIYLTAFLFRKHIFGYQTAQNVKDRVIDKVRETRERKMQEKQMVHGGWQPGYAYGQPPGVGQGYSGGVSAPGTGSSYSAAKDRGFQHLNHFKDLPKAPLKAQPNPNIGQTSTVNRAKNAAKNVAKSNLPNMGKSGILKKKPQANQQPSLTQDKGQGASTVAQREAAAGKATPNQDKGHTARSNAQYSGNPKAPLRAQPLPSDEYKKRLQEQEQQKQKAATDQKMAQERQMQQKARFDRNNPAPLKAQPKNENVVHMDQHKREQNTRGGRS